MVEKSGDDEYRKQLTWMVNDILEVLMDLDMEPKPESLWWTSTYEAEDDAESGKGIQVTERTVKNKYGKLVAGEARLSRVSLRRKCQWSVTSLALL